uniref:Uncharacterized protein n=1 Tax=Romanomermis culicivorax TaxID=13658 RepID=A0A915K1I2_ROMCU
MNRGDKIRLPPDFWFLDDDDEWTIFSTANFAVKVLYLSDLIIRSDDLEYRRVQKNEKKKFSDQFLQTSYHNLSDVQSFRQSHFWSIPLSAVNYPSNQIKRITDEAIAEVFQINEHKYDNNYCFHNCKRRQAIPEILQHGKRENDNNKALMRENCPRDTVGSQCWFANVDDQEQIAANHCNLHK